MTVTLLPDPERIVSAFLRSRSEITDLVAQRVYTALPSNPTTPLVRLTRLGGAPVRSQRLWLDAPRLQVESYGGPKVLAQEIAQTCRAVLAEAPADEHEGGVITDVRFGELLWLPDDTWLSDGTARPRYVFDCTVYAHPGGLPVT